MIKYDWKHFLKIDHIAFLFILPAIILDFKLLALVSWLIALLWDIYEQYEQRSEENTSEKK